MSQTTVQKSSSSVVQPGGLGDLMTEQSRRGWVVLAVIFIAMIPLFGGGFLSFGAFFDPLVKEFGWSHATTSLLLTIFFLAMGVSQPLVGWLLDQIEARYVMTAGALMVGAAFMLAARAKSYEPMMLAYILLGFGVGFSTLAPLSVVVANWFGEQRGLAFGIALSGTAIGGFLMVRLASHFIVGTGWRTAYVWLAICSFVVIPPILVLVRNQPSGGHRHSSAEEKLIAGLAIGEAFRSRALWLIVLAYFGYTFVVGVIIAHFIPYLIGIGVSPTSAHDAYSNIQITAFVGCLLSGYIVDRLNVRPVAVVMLVLMSLSVASLLAIRHPGVETFFVIVFGFNVAAPTAMIMLLLSEAVGLRHFGFFSGLATVAATLGDASGPIVAGHMFDVLGNYHAAFILSAASAMVGALMIAALPALRFARPRS